MPTRKIQSKMTYSSLYKELFTKLSDCGISDASSDLRLLFEHFLQKDRNFLLAHGDDNIPESDAKVITDAVNRRLLHIPLQHITGKADFMGLSFEVNENVLIPRFDTECLVEEVMTECCDGAKVLDVCTGSGCIIISLMCYKNDIEGYATDISPKALEVAKRNADALNANVVFFEGDLFENVTEKGFDYIISNPPYIRSGEINSLMEEVKDHDPVLALDGGEDGLIFYRRIADEAKAFLKIGGKIFFEIGNDQGDDVKRILESLSYKNIKVIKDYAGNDRIVSGTV